MTVDLGAAENFIWSTARLVDRHRYSLLFADGQQRPVVEALRGYRNPDGGFGHGLEPDLRGPASQPAATLYTLEILNEADASDDQLAIDARSWIASIAGPDGGIPFVLPGFEGYPHAPWWAATRREHAGRRARVLSDHGAHRGPPRRWRNRGRLARSRHRMVVAVDRDHPGARRILVEVHAGVPRLGAR